MMKRPRGYWSIALTSMIVLAPTVGRAAEPPGAVQTPQVSGNAQDDKTLVRQAADAYLRRDYETARKALEQAYAVAPRPDTLLKLGLAELEAGHPVEAVEHLRAYLQSTGEPPSKLDLVRNKWLPRAESQTAELEVFAPAGAQVLIDGALQPTPSFATLDEVRGGKPSLSIRIAAGAHDVTTAQGTLRESQHVSAKGGERLELHFQRVPDSPASVSTTQPESAAATPDRAIPRTGERGRAQWITIATLGTAAVAASAVALGFTIAFEENAANARTIRDQIGSATSSGCRSPAAPQCPTLSQIDDAEQRDGALATGFYIAGGAAAALAAAAWLLLPAREGRGLEAAPMIGRESTGVSLRGAW